MTNQQENRLSMYLSFKDFQASYTAITDTLPHYKTNSSTFVNIIPQIQIKAEQQKTSTKGFTIIKNSHREALVVITSDYVRKLSAYAKFTGNIILAQEIKFSESKLRQAVDAAVKDYAQIVYDRAHANLVALDAYGISGDTQTALLSGINDYIGSLGKPGANRTESGNTTRQLGDLFKTADIALANMDTAVGIVRLTQLDFYSSYKNARKVIETNNGSVVLKGLVTDAVSNKPIKGVRLSFSPESNTGLANGTKNATKSFVKKTAEKGGFNIRSLPSGIYAVAVKKVGYADHVATVAIAAGDLTKLYIQLSKS